jgi:DNA-directed RNA polymerase specialized sigma24 family protein
LYRYAARLLKICPPSIYLALTPARREDVLHDLMLHCCRDDFRVLRRYRDRGRPFAAWLQLVTRNLLLDRWRTDRLATAVPLESDDDDRPDVVVPDPAPGADRELDGRRLLDAARDAMQRLSAECRLLLQGAAEGLKPRQLVRLMGWPADWNKKASDDLRACRGRLRKLLQDRGLAPEGWQGAAQ